MNNLPRPSDDIIRMMFRHMVEIIKHLVDCEDVTCQNDLHRAAQDVIADSNEAKERALKHITNNI